MATMRTSVRDGSRPVAIDESDLREVRRSQSKHHSRRKGRTRRHESHQQSHQASYTVAVPSNNPFDPTSAQDDAPSWELSFVQGPDEKIAIGRSVKVEVMVSLRLPQRHSSIHPMHLDYSRLITFATLVAEDQSGKLYPMEASALLAQKTCDTVHSFPHPEKQCALFWHQSSDHLPLGFSSFPELRIARPGTYRIRITLMRTGGSAEEGAINVTCIDSMPISVCPPPTRRR